ncbi:protein PRRC1-A [Caerostris extrusa]|uniref:Protein PRRC1-A n=1 Tax=Caerostris extrusa TaxID=172846 RepID=A0AAV4WC80_CAEEX|nr:protein PRRC1-A [Caerostris extrusa]
MGHSAGLKAAEIKISYARQSNLILENDVAVSTSVVLSQAVSQRWQMMTIICLDDPNLNLNLHNFTTTIPIPNEYVKEAEQLTSSDYHLRDQGLAVNLEQTIEYMSGIKPRNMEEFLTGVNRYKLLKSATLALAGTSASSYQINLSYQPHEQQTGRISKPTSSELNLYVSDKVKNIMWRKNTSSSPKWALANQQKFTSAPQNDSNDLADYLREMFMKKHASFEFT